MKIKRFSKKIIGLVLPIIIILFSYYVLPNIGTAPKDGAEYPLKVYFIDVGQGDAALIDAGGKYIMIDGGTEDSADDTIDFMREIGVSGLECIIASHPHEDHIGGFAKIINVYPTAKAYIPDASATTRAFENFIEALDNSDVETVSAGCKFNVGDAKFEVFAPQPHDYKETNNKSVCVKLTYGNISYLFTGDAEKISEDEMLSEEYDLKSDVLKAAHHGSGTSCSDEFLAAVSPEISVISAGRNSYGLPDEKTVGKLQSCSRLYRTDLNGTISVMTDGNKTEVKCDYN